RETTARPRHHRNSLAHPRRARGAAGPATQPARPALRTRLSGGPAPAARWHSAARSRARGGTRHEPLAPKAHPWREHYNVPMPPVPPPPGPSARVIVGLSGGVDSAVAALLLKEARWDVQGLFLSNWEEEDDDGYCTAAQDFQDARAVAAELGI